MEADITSQAVGLASNTDFSIIKLFIRADLIVKTVILILIVSSIYSWAIIFEKIKLFKKINKSTEEFEEKFWKSKSAESFYNNLPANVNDPMANVFKSSMNVLLKSKRSSNLNEKMSRMLEINIEQQMEKIEKKLYVSCKCRVYRSIYRVVWYCLGHNEFFPINSYFKKH